MRDDYRAGFRKIGSVSERIWDEKRFCMFYGVVL